jgi:hypothetical protein
MFKVFAHQSDKFRVENTVTKSTKLHTVLKNQGVIATNPHTFSPRTSNREGGYGEGAGRERRGQSGRERDRRRREMESGGEK